MTLSGLLFLLVAQDPVPPAEPTALEDLVVTAGSPAPPLDPFSPFRELCFDGNRLQGRAIHPGGDTLWVPLEDDERAALGLTDEAGTGYLLETEALTLVLRIEETPDDFLRRHVCSVTIVGDHDQQDLVRRMSTTFGGPGTRHHLDYEQFYPSRPGWTQVAWAAIPARDDPDWRVFMPRRGARSESGFVVVTEPWFYARSRYVVGEVRFTAQGERPVSVLSLTHLFKP